MPWCKESGAAMNVHVVTVPHMFPGRRFYDEFQEFDLLQDQAHPSKTKAGTKLAQESPQKLQIARHAVHDAVDDIICNSQ